MQNDTIMFDTNATEKLGYYVYGLFDPRSPEWPFYIGKGRENRVFAHAKGDYVMAGDDVEIDVPMAPKLEQIANIRQAGLEIQHKIIRYGLSEDEALKVEACLIDMVNHIRPGTLTNQISGHGVAEGIYDADDLAVALCAKELKTDEPLLIIKIEQKWTALLDRYGSGSRVPVEEIFEATKGTWKVNIARASKAKCVLAVARGLVRAVFVPTGWMDSGASDGRKAIAGTNDASQYHSFVGTSVAHLFRRGGQNPLRYQGC